MQVTYSINCIFMLSLVGVILIFDDDNLIGPRQFFQSPHLLLSILCQILLMQFRNKVY